MFQLKNHIFFSKGVVSMMIRLIFTVRHYIPHQNNPSFLKSDVLFDMLFNVIIKYLCKSFFRLEKSPKKF